MALINQDHKIKLKRSLVTELIEAFYNMDQYTNSESSLIKVLNKYGITISDKENGDGDEKDNNTIFVYLKEGFIDEIYNVPKGIEIRVFNFDIDEDDLKKNSLSISEEIKRVDGELAMVLSWINPGDIVE